jgi:hypothetical protein
MIDIRPTHITVINRTGLDLANEQDRATAQSFMEHPDWREICDDLEPYVEPFTREDHRAFQWALWSFVVLDSIAIVACIGLLVRWLFLKLL